MNWGHRIDNNCIPHSDGRDVKGRGGKRFKSENYVDEKLVTQP